MVDTTIKEKASIPVGDFSLPGDLEIPQNANALVVFSHGSGSSRLSPRNQFVAATLREKGMGTFLFDLLAPEEDDIRARFDIEGLTNRLLLATEWLLTRPNVTDLSIGYFGASTGAASALHAAAQLGDRIKAVVSRGGRPDLAMAALPDVKAATLLIVGSRDDEVLRLNQEALKYLHYPKTLVVVPGATHLFEEPGKLEEVAKHASEWFMKYLGVGN